MIHYLSNTFKVCNVYSKYKVQLVELINSDFVKMRNIVAWLFWRWQIHWILKISAATLRRTKHRSFVTNNTKMRRKDVACRMWIKVNYFWYQHPFGYRQTRDRFWEGDIYLLIWTKDTNVFCFSLLSGEKESPFRAKGIRRNVQNANEDDSTFSVVYNGAIVVRWCQVVSTLTKVCTSTMS